MNKILDNTTKYNNVCIEDISSESLEVIKRFKEIDNKLFCDDVDAEEWEMLEEAFYDIVMDIAESKNPHIDWNCAEQSVFNLVAEDRVRIIDAV